MCNYVGHMPMKSALTSAITSGLYFPEHPIHFSLVYLCIYCSFCYNSPLPFILRNFIQIKKCFLFWGSITLETLPNYNSFHIITTCLHMFTIPSPSAVSAHLWDRDNILIHLFLQPQDLLQKSSVR